MKNLKVTICCLLLSCLSNAQWNVHWSVMFDYTNHSAERTELLIPDPTGGVFCIGYTIPPQQQKSDLLILKYDDAGSLLWSEVYTRSGDRNERPHGAVVDHAGNLIVTGEGFDVNNVADVLLLKYSSSGQLMWEDSIDGTSGAYDRGSSVCVDDSDNVYVTGYLYNGTFKGYLAKYSPAGTPMYLTIIPTLQHGHHVRFDNNFIYLYGITGVSGSPYHTQILKLDRNGSTLSSYTINDANDNHIAEMIRDNDRMYLLDIRGGGSSGLTTYGIHCLDSNLTYQWKNYHSSSMDLNAQGMVMYDSSLYVATSEWNGSMSFQLTCGISRISKADGSLTSQVPVIAGSSLYGYIFNQVVDSSGVISVAFLPNANPSGNGVKYLTRFDAGLQPLGLLALPDSMTYGDISIYQKDNHTIYYFGTAWDTVGGNEDFLLYKLSDLAVGTAELSDDRVLQVFPNPFTESVTLKTTSSTMVDWQISDMHGRLLVEGHTSGEQHIDLHSLASGMYLLNCREQGVARTVKIIKQ